MPASSIDTFLACSIMVVLIVSSMAGMTKILQPHLNYSTIEDNLWHQTLSEYILTSCGDPQNWGELKESLPSTFGLASQIQKPYELDPDKVSRLNNESIYSLSYQEIFEALGATDFSLNMKVQPLFDVAINLTTSYIEENTTIYTFRITVSNASNTLATSLKCYLILGTYINHTSAVLDQNSASYTNFTLSNSLNGSALLVVFAESNVYSGAISFNAYIFSHNTPQIPKPNKTYLRLSPIEQSLTASFKRSNITVQNAYVFTNNYHFNLSQMTINNQTLEINIPNLLEPSPAIFVLTGNNVSNTFIEWGAYPQIPLEIGVNLNDITSKSNVIAQPYLVTINSVLYEFIITLRRTTT